jgi:hypothetical protein
MTKKLVVLFLTLMLAHGVALADIITIAADGDVELATPYPGNVVNRSTSSIKPESNIDGATIEIGVKDDSGAFLAYENGLVTVAQGKYVRHGTGVTLMLRVTGITANSVIVGYN